MTNPPKPQPGVHASSSRALVPVRAVAVEAVDGDDVNGIDIIVDSQITLYRFRMKLLKALSLSHDIQTKVITRVVNREIESRG